MIAHKRSLIRLSRTIANLALLLAGPAAAQGIFTNVAEDLRFPLPDFDYAAVGDYDNDGRPDLYLEPRIGSDVILLHNNEDGSFSEWESMSLPDELKGLPGEIGLNAGASFGDYDNDGDLDLFVRRGWRVSQLSVDAMHCCATIVTASWM